MILIPAIDLRNGKVVRLTQGSFDQETMYSESPADVMQQWQSEGALLVHVVDLDGAREGEPKNLDAMKRILDVARVPIQFGGGLRTFDTISSALKSGISRVVIGTQAFEPSLLEMLTQQFQDKIVVSVDVRDGAIQKHGWQARASSQSPKAFCQYLQAMGVRTVTITDISRDGTLQGPNFELLDQILTSTKMNVIVSGGISALSDLEQLHKIKHPHFTGVIIGKALYENKFKLSEAVERFQNGER